MGKRIAKGGDSGKEKTKRGGKKTKVKSKTRKPSRKRMRNKLDHIFSLKIRERGACERCGKKETLQASHIYSRSNLAVRWDLDNCFCYCAGCHFWWHKNPVEAGEWTKEKMGNERYQALRKKANQIKKWTDQELNNLYLELCQTKLSVNTKLSSNENSQLENL